VEVFIAFDGKLEAVPFLEKALNGWDKVRFADPMVIEVKPGELFEIQRRVIADGLAKEDFYVLADIDAAPEETNFLKSVHQKIHAKVGLAFIRPYFDLGGRVRVIRKGLVEKWPPVETAMYDEEHGQQIVKTGRTVEHWDIWYRYLPSVLVN
jgi:hypothetical protein